MGVGAEKKVIKVCMIQSPCVRNCCLDDDDVCLGCGRTIAEITGWHQADDAAKQDICQVAAARLSAKRRSRESASVTRQTGADDAD